mmetsp:Transcript_9691/g.28976  ORF Transcript_9691/g.28976 Transcript_9691/m.28976 type:complete len:123 (+) Transcript_9691:19-387(+)|eukprot:CAMPEP_0119259336 /NCGR_PEP_ID=MMETSP1329-20130426/194_1 /TAXON_ID=114041 /ORGANISM="Genus nov. species nov., Strain RCC1024" /LENGTH=122 /DNA_ID=CAMNT_0007258711 /DNA_START=200 /DNA_END=568 /DNA_ORIENTATION=-
MVLRALLLISSSAAVGALAPRAAPAVTRRALFGGVAATGAATALATPANAEEPESDLARAMREAGEKKSQAEPRSHGAPNRHLAYGQFEPGRKRRGKDKRVFEIAYGQFEPGRKRRSKHTEA